MPDNGTYATAEEILAASKSSEVYEDLSVEEWGGVRIPIGTLTGGEVGEYKGFIANLRHSVHGQGRKAQVEVVIEQRIHQAMAMLCWLAMKDPKTGQRIFRSREEVEQLTYTGLVKVHKVATRLNPIDQEMEEALGKGSDETPNASSGGDSPDPAA